MLFLASLCIASPSLASVAFRGAASSSNSGAAIAFRAAGTVDSDSGSTSNITPGLPAGTAAGDLLIAVVESRDNVALSMTGWNLLFNQNGGNAGHQAAIFWRIATGADPNTITHPNGGDVVIGRILGFSGVDTTNPFETLPLAAGNSSYNASTTTTTSGAQTTTNATAMLVFTAHFGNDFVGTPTTPAGFNAAFVNETTTGNNASIAAFYQVQATAGAKGPVSFNWASGGATVAAATHGVLFALRPNAGVLRINKPTGTSVGDVMIASVAVTPSTAIVTAPVGWNLVRQVTQAGATTSTLLTYSRVTGTGEPTNYAWSLTAHSGTVGGIMSFHGVDASNPIDDQLGNATPAAGTSVNHVASSVTTTLDDGMLVTIHELASSSSWTPPAGPPAMTEAVDIASLTVGNAAGISMEMNYEPRSTAGATGTRTATASANADRGATQSISLKPLPLICFTDSFTGPDNASPGPDWVASSVSGTFGAPRIVGNRLRLTNASATVSTMASLQRLFPGAGNRIEVEFDHFAYGGSGADGVAVTLSDSAVTPTPGAFGGSLGYAQKSNPGSDCTVPGGCPGFAGGWIGVGIDEYGNFSTNTEGRVGGGGARINDSVSIRGSGSGQSGYTFHAGTGTLAPGIDLAGATPAPGYRYRVIVDHSNAVNAYVSVERDVGAGYTFLIPAYDAKMRAGQANVPANWLLSYTGSTGGLNNIHEIDNLSICAATQTPISGIHHFEITVGTSASTCASQNVTIVAKDSANNTLTSYTGTINITTSTLHGDWSVSAPRTVNNGTADDGAATYTFTAGDAGSVVLNFTNTHADDLTIYVTDAAAPSTSSATATPISFRDSAFVVTPDPIQIAGRNQAVTITLYTRLGASCTPDTNYSGSKNLDAWLTLDPQDPGGTLPTLNGVSLPTLAPASSPVSNNIPSVTFTGGVATVTLATIDIGKYILNVRDDTRLYASAVDLGGASTSITTRPWLYVSVPGNQFADTLGGNVFTSAGTNFTATVTGVLWQSVDDDNVVNGDGIPDADADLSDNTVATRFAWPTTLSPVAPITPSSGIPGTLDRASGGNTVAQIGFTSGAATTADWRYSEVGSFTMAATANNFLNSGINISTTNNVVGRFRPHHFNVAYTPACALGVFTYSGQPFFARVTAYSQLGNVTLNYDHDLGFAKTTTLLVNGVDTANLTNKTFDGSTNPLEFNDGVASRADVTYTFPAKETAPLVPSVLPLPPVTPLGASDGEVSSATGIEPQIHIRSGRLLIQNAFGSELLDLAVPMRVQYYDGNGWATNTLDACSGITLSPLSYVAGGTLVLGDTCVQDSGVGAGLSLQGCGAPGPV
ncbi:MAG TPA: DUF6701 domain-containing protein, partial [Burkholderiales bacterium]|nr:DUF6701 domain-containing protein [Burkholderiales bacterium]